MNGVSTEDSLRKIKNRINMIEDKNNPFYDVKAKFLEKKNE